MRVLRDFEREGVRACIPRACWYLFMLAFERLHPSPSSTRCSCFPLLFQNASCAACSQVKCDKFFKYMSDEHPAFAAENGTRSKTLVTVAESMHTEECAQNREQTQHHVSLCIAKAN